MESFPEFFQLQRMIDKLAPHAPGVRIETPASVRKGGKNFPIYTITLGSSRPEAPVFGLVAGVYGRQKVGSQVVLSYLEHLIERMAWDEALQWQLERMKLILMPVVSPVRQEFFTRYLKWYHGQSDRLEPESQALCDFIKKECFGSPQSIILEVRSGMGTQDHLWFAYAKDKKPFPNLAEISAFKSLLDRVLPNSFYRIHPWSSRYKANGGVWDGIYDEFGLLHADAFDQGEKVFLPLTLELGLGHATRAPRDLSYATHSFMRRALGNHLPLFDLVSRSVLSPGPWKSGPTHQRELNREQGMDLWYRKTFTQRLFKKS
jgi:hypothetical protein